MPGNCHETFTVAVNSQRIGEVLRNSAHDIPNRIYTPSNYLFYIFVLIFWDDENDTNKRSLF